MFLPQSPIQETSWVPVGFESCEKQVTLSDASPWLDVWKLTSNLFNEFVLVITINGGFQA